MPWNKMFVLPWKWKTGTGPILPLKSLFQIYWMMDWKMWVQFYKPGFFAVKKILSFLMRKAG